MKSRFGRRSAPYALFQEVSTAALAAAAPMNSRRQSRFTPAAIAVLHRECGFPPESCGDHPSAVPNRQGDLLRPPSTPGMGGDSGAQPRDENSLLGSVVN